MLLAHYALLLMGAYSIGSIPTGYILAYYRGIKDIRNHGSGNIGATNVARILGFRYFMPVFIIDATKAAWYLMMLKAFSYEESFLLLCALALVVGNSYSLFLHFTGGKGFATIVGIVCVLKPSLTALLIGIWTTVIALTRTVGVASAATCLGLMVSGMYFFASHSCIALTFMIIGLWGTWRHVDNIKRYTSTLF